MTVTLTIPPAQIAPAVVRVITLGPAQNDAVPKRAGVAEAGHALPAAST